MKIKDDFVLKDMGDFSVVIAVGESLKKYNCMITLNESGKLLWEKLSAGCERADLVNAITAVYDVDEEHAQKDVDAFLTKLKNANII